jgi:hypothetical protein
VNMQLSQYIASDLAPSGSQCEGKGCSKLAEQRLTIRDGSGHNVSKLFCCSCSEACACAIEDTKTGAGSPRHSCRGGMRPSLFGALEEGLDKLVFIR